MSVTCGVLIVFGSVPLCIKGMWLSKTVQEVQRINNQVQIMHDNGDYSPPDHPELQMHKSLL